MGGIVIVIVIVKRIEPKGNWEEYGRKVEKLLENRKFGSLSADVSHS